MSVEIYLIFPYIGKVVRLYIYKNVLMIDPDKQLEIPDILCLLIAVKINTYLLVVDELPMPLQSVSI